MGLFRFIKELVVTTNQNKELLRKMDNVALMKRLNKKDICIHCETVTPYDKTTNINNRLYYIEGAGQLCRDCYAKIYDIKQMKYDEI